ncbi:hypothetical protein AGMMS49579_26030 [Spirochaetia bacterium]|nr:hypothetical protein AGMMS49579_26030 [Spirochaetia bacterium]
MVVKIRLVFSICFIFIALYAHPQNTTVLFKVNDSGVRLRGAPGLTGTIIRTLEKNEIVEYIDSEDLRNGSEYKWVNVKTSKGNGWVHGEYLNYHSKDNIPFYNIDDARVIINGKSVLMGISEEELLSILGNPVSRYDSIDYEGIAKGLKYGLDKKLSIEILNRNKRIFYIAITSPLYPLANGIKVGMNISGIDNVQDGRLPKNDPNIRGYFLKNYLRNAFYDSVILLLLNADGIIEEIGILVQGDMYEF